IPDNSLPMLLRLLHRIGVKNVALAGFDGYVAEAGQNYMNPAMEYEFAKDYAVRLNDYTSGIIASLKADMDISFVTESRYRA
nr:3-hydroxy-3-methylglutaryl-CoA lyase [Lachnospiraceae bacterium]